MVTLDAVGHNYQSKYSQRPTLSTLSVYKTVIMSTVSVQHCQFKNTIVIMSTVSEQCCQHFKFIQLLIQVLIMTKLVHIVSFHNCHYDKSVYNFVNNKYNYHYEYCQSTMLSTLPVYTAVNMSSVNPYHCHGHPINLVLVFCSVLSEWTMSEI